MRTAPLLVLLAGCGGAPCLPGHVETGVFGTCCLPGQDATLFGACTGPATACPEGHRLVDGACARLELPPFRLVRVEAGSFVMGCLPERDGADVRCVDNDPFEATISRPFAIGATEVTQGLYEALMGTNPTRLPPDPYKPVDNVSFFDAVRFANALSAWEGRYPAYRIEGEGEDARVVWNREADGYRLPTEAEWEYAARAGEETPYAGGFDADEVAVHEGTQRGGPSRVASKRPNAWGLYDMSGNLFEWTTTGRFDYPTEPAVDPLGPEDPPTRSVRGGAWSGIPGGLILSTRGDVPPGFKDVILGFRVVRPVRDDEPAVLEPAGPWAPVP